MNQAKVLAGLAHPERRTFEATVNRGYNRPVLLSHNGYDKDIVGCGFIADFSGTSLTLTHVVVDGQLVEDMTFSMQEKTQQFQSYFWEPAWICKGLKIVFDIEYYPNNGSTHIDIVK